MLSCHPETVREWLRKGRIQGKRIGRRWFVEPGEIRVDVEHVNGSRG